MITEIKKYYLTQKLIEKKQTKKISTKILKMDKNNEYGQAMAKPLPYGCIKNTP